VKVYETETGREVAVLEGHQDDVQAVAFTPDSRDLVSASLDGTVAVWRLSDATCRFVCRGHALGVTGVAVSPDAKHLASGSTDRTAIVWDAGTGAALHVLPHPGWVWALEFSPRGDELHTACTDGSFRTWSLESGGVIRTTRTGSPNLKCAILDRAGERAIVGGTDGYLRILEVATGREIAAIHGFDDQVNDVALSPDETRLLACGGRHVRLWDVASGQLVLSLRGHQSNAYAVAFHPDGTQIATGGGGWVGEDCSLRLWGRVPGQAWPPDPRRVAPPGR
jgi:hypothetical protein